MNQYILRFAGLVLALFALAGMSHAQTPAFSRALGVGPAGGSGNAEGNAMAVDALGNIYVTGLFAGTVQLGSFTLSSGPPTSTTLPGKSLYVAKYSPAGICLWATVSAGSHFGPSDTSEFPAFQSIAVDNAGGIYVVGSFSGTATFGGVVLTAGSSYVDFFVARLDAAGSWTGATVGRSGQARGVAVDGSGNAYVVGAISGQSVFGSISLQTVGSYDVFVAKLSSAGTWLWAVRGGGYNVDWANGITLDAAGNAYITGAFEPAINGSAFGATILTAAYTTSTAATDIFVAKVSAAGTWQWAVQAGTNNYYDAGEAIAHDASGNLYLTGYHGGATFGSTVLSSAGALSNVGAQDAFVAKLDAGGNWLWATGGGGGGSDMGTALAVDGSGNAYLTGFFSGYSTAAVGSTATFGSTTLTRSGSSSGDAFTAKVTSAGTWQWALQGGGTSEDRGYGIATNGSGAVYTTGTYASASAAFGSATLVLNASTAAFITRLDAAGNYAWTNPVNGASIVSAAATTVDNQGNYYTTGSFTGTCVVGGTRLTSTGPQDMYVAKLDGLGNYLWVVKGGGPGADSGLKLATDAAGNAFVTGTCQAGLVTFGALSQTLASTSQVVVKLDASGNAVWLASSTGSLATPTVAGIAVDGNGDAYLTGYFVGRTASFGTTTLTNAAVNAPNSRPEPLMGPDVFVAKLSSTGSWLWAVRGGSGGGNWTAMGGGGAVNDSDDSKGIATDAAGNVYIAGSINATSSYPAAFGSSILSTTFGDAFVAKLSAATGAWQWAVQSRAGANAYAGNNGVAVDANGNVYTSGIFAGNVSFGNQSLTASANAYNTYVAKLNPAGSWQWASSGTGKASSTGIAVDGSGAAYIAGAATGAVTFGPATLASNGGDDAFVAKVNSSGAWQWAVNGGGSGNDAVSGLAVTSSGTVCITGAFRSSAATFGSFSLVGNNSLDTGFIAWLGNLVLAARPALPSQEFALWPNPSRGQVWINGLPASQVVRAYNNLGQLVAADVVPASAAAWQFVLPASLPAGIYVVRSGKVSRQLIIE